MLSTLESTTNNMHTNMCFMSKVSFVRCDIERDKYLYIVKQNSLSHLNSVDIDLKRRTTNTG